MPAECRYERTSELSALKQIMPGFVRGLVNGNYSANDDLVWPLVIVHNARDRVGMGVICSSPQNKIYVLECQFINSARSPRTLVR